MQVEEGKDGNERDNRDNCAPCLAGALLLNLTSAVWQNYNLSEILHSVLDN